jgi:hypothetical protein
MATFKISKRENIKILIIMITIIVCSSLLIGCASVSTYKILTTKDFDVDNIENYRIENYSKKDLKVFKFDIINFSRNEAPQGVGRLSLTKRVIDGIEEKNGVALVDVKYTYRSIGILSPYFFNFGWASISADKVMIENTNTNTFGLKQD